MRRDLMSTYHEPPIKRVVTFFDCQNLFGMARKWWAYSRPNFDPIKLSRFVVRKNQDWNLTGIRLYTGIHSFSKNPGLNRFWNRKLNAHKLKDPRVYAYTAPLLYTANDTREKGIDIRIALDLIRMARKNQYDVAVLFSQDSDFKEVAMEIRDIAFEKQRWIKIASTCLCNRNSDQVRGIDRTDWIKISKSDYDMCIDQTEYSKS